MADPAAGCPGSVRVTSASCCVSRGHSVVSLDDAFLDDAFLDIAPLDAVSVMLASTAC